MKNELILELCRLESYDKEKIEMLLEKNRDETYILGCLLLHRMGGTAYYILRECNLLSKISREFRSSLKAIYEQGMCQTESFRYALDKLAMILSGTNIPYIVLKGGWLVDIYPDGLRTSNDIDVLIKREEIKTIVELLSKNGYQQGYIRNEKMIMQRDGKSSMHT